MQTRTLSVDFCVVGGGMAGLCAALAAARRGCRTALLQDRPVLGGNASSEIRMWICGAHGENNHETGILEEILLENAYLNRVPNYSVWDSILYGKARFQENLTLLLNTYVDAAETRHGRILSVSGNQMTTETRCTVQAGLFADCTGDGLLGALAGAEFRLGREARSEFDERIAPETADRCTMGLSCLIQARETDRPQPFIPPPWAHRYPDDEHLPRRPHTLAGLQNFWWIELGGTGDVLHDGETLRDELLKIAFGVWDHIKNHGDHGAERWTLEWVGFLPGKRESRRLVGDHILTQNDVEAEGRHFPDIVGYGGWTMDDHFPEGFHHKDAGTTFHPAPAPYGIPFRSLYSRNLDNLLFAGRNISASHCALSSTRVMATCATLGQAIGTAAAIAARDGLTPRGVYESRLDELQQTLLWDDCYLPFQPRRLNALTRAATLEASTGDPEPLRNGWDRPIGAARNAWDARPGDWVVCAWAAPQPVRALRLVFDSDLSRTTRNMVATYPLVPQEFAVPPPLVRAFRVEGDSGDGAWRTLAETADNHQRLVRVPVGTTLRRLRFTATATWGAEALRVFALDVE